MDNDNEVKINDDNNTNAKNEILLKYLDSLLEQIFLDENSTKLTCVINVIDKKPIKDLYKSFQTLKYIDSITIRK